VNTQNIAHETEVPVCFRKIGKSLSASNLRPYEDQNRVDTLKVADLVPISC